MQKLFYSIIPILLLLNISNAQTYDLQCLVEKNEGVVNGDFSVKIQIKSNGSFFGMGTSNLVFSYNTSALSTPILLTTYNFDGFIPPNTFYQAIATTQPFSDVVSVNIVLSSGTGTGQIVQNTWMDVATISFVITDPLQSTMLAWRTMAPNRTNVFDDLSNEIPANNLSGINIVLPVNPEQSDQIPSEFYMSDNYPNPFNPLTNFKVGIPQTAGKEEFTIGIVDIFGRRIRTLFKGTLNSGVHQFAWNGRNETGNKISAGTYFYCLRSRKFNSVKKMVLLK